MYTGLHDFLKVKGFSIVHQNIRGLAGKKDLVQDLLFSHNKVNILSGSEMFFSEKIYLEIWGYVHSFKYKNRTNWRMCCCLHKNGIE